MQGDKNTCPNFALCACVTGSKEKESFLSIISQSKDDPQSVESVVLER